MSDAERFLHERQLAAFEQNSLTFRSLNQLMWQIPLIGMTLTGGLWFGVSKVDEFPLFQSCLLLLAFTGNIGLIFILARLRYIMSEYLTWLKEFDSDGFVEAKGTTFSTKPKAVRTVFQILLGVAALMSGTLFVITASGYGNEKVIPNALSRAVEFYDTHARNLADGYEAISFQAAHPFLVEYLKDRPSSKVLDIGAGTGRDAAWLAENGHTVVAVEPSIEMLRLAKSIHTDKSISWVQDSLPALQTFDSSKGFFDLVVLSAVWMHVQPTEREKAISNIAALLRPNGVIYLTLRIGPTDPSRDIYWVSIGELQELGRKHGLVTSNLGKRPDLLQRSEVSWQAVTMSKLE